MTNFEKFEKFHSRIFGDVRVIKEDKVLFCASDVARALGYTNPWKAVRDHCKRSIERWLNDSFGRPQKTKFIPEGDVYRLIARSKLPEAEKFESWIFDEVLPLIRATGGYVDDVDKFLDNYLVGADAKTKLLVKQSLEMARYLNDEKVVLGEVVAAQAPMVQFARHAAADEEGEMTVGEFAKLMYEREHMDIGSGRLLRWLRNEGLFMKKGTTNVPYQKHVTSGLFSIRKRKVGGYTSSHFVTTVYITAKGQAQLCEMLHETYTGVLGA